jgi:hypothetical protein
VTAGVTVMEPIVVNVSVFERLSARSHGSSSHQGKDRLEAPFDSCHPPFSPCDT